MKQVIIYPGRFQPMLSHHAEVYSQLQSQFPEADVYIGTSDKVESGKSPFTFAEKQQIATAHGIEPSKVLQAKRPYHKDDYPFDEENTVIIFAVGEKDMDRFPFSNVNPDTDLDMMVKDKSKPKYYQKINTYRTDPKPMAERGYITLAPTISVDNEVASASAFRDALKNAPDKESAEQVYTKQFGNFDPKIFELIYGKITGQNDMNEELNNMRKLAGMQPLTESFDPAMEPNSESTMFDAAMDAYDDHGEDGLAQHLGMSSEEFDAELNELGAHKGLHADDDRDELVQLLVQDLIDNREVDEPDYSTEAVSEEKAPSHYDLEQAYFRIYQMTDEMGDEALEQMNEYAPKFSDALERAEGDIEDIPAEEIPAYMAELDNAAFEMGAPELEAVSETKYKQCKSCAGEGCDHCGGTGKHAIEEVEANEFEKTIAVNQSVELAGDSIWDKEGTKNPNSIEVKDIVVHAPFDVEDGDNFVEVSVNHNGPWTIYTDTGFEAEISKLVGFKVKFTEQGMQEEGVASLEGDKDDTAVAEDIARMRHLSGLEEAEMPDFDKGERPRNSKERVAYRNWKKDSAAGAKKDDDVVSISPKDKRDAEARPANAAAADPSTAQFTDITLKGMKVDGKSIPSSQRAKSIANQFPEGSDLTDPAVKKEVFLKFTAKRPDLMFGEINARLSNDEQGLAISDRLSPIVRQLEDSRNIMELEAEDKSFALKLLQSAITDMELVKSTDIDKQIDVEPMQLDTDGDDEDYDDDAMVPVLDTDGDDDLVRDSVNFDSIRAGYDVLPEGKMKDVIQDAMDMSREEFEQARPGFDYDEIIADYGDELDEGKLPAGLQAYQDKRNGKKDDADKDEDKEVDEDKDEDKDEVDEALNDMRRAAGIEIVEGAKIDCPCCNGGNDSCSNGKDVCGTCDGTGKVDEAYEAVVEAVVEEVAEVVTNSALNDAMAELKALAGI